MSSIKPRLPDFFLVGAAKSGTTALYHLLGRHPGIFLSPIKEPNHFCTDIRPEQFSRAYALHEKRKRLDLDRYLAGPMEERHFDYFVTKPQQYAALFRDAGDAQAVGEMSNSYLFSKVAAKNIRKAIPHARILMLLRNPVDRLFSHYLANLRDGKTRRSLADEIRHDRGLPRKGWWISHNYCETGMYCEQVRRYTDVFPPGQVKIILYDDFVADPVATMKGIFRFLSVDAGADVDFTGRYNEALEPRSPALLYLATRSGLKQALFRLVPRRLAPRIKRAFFKRDVTLTMPPETAVHLQAFYRSDIECLERLAGLDLGRWKAGPGNVTNHG